MNRYDELKKYIEENAKLAYDLNYAVAADPELSGCEYRACARYVELCRQMGWPVEENFTKQKTAFRAVVTRPETNRFNRDAGRRVARRQGCYG